MRVRAFFSAVSFFLILSTALVGGPVQASSSMWSAPARPEVRQVQDGAPAGGLDAILEQIRAEEYNFTWTDHTYLPDLPAGYQAPNRAQNLRTYLTDSGVTLIPRLWPEEGALPWRWQVQITGWGQAGALQPAAPGPVRVEGNRAEYPLDGLATWCRNGEAGLALGFTFGAPPVEADPGAPLRLEMALGGTLLPDQAANGPGLIFRSPEGTDGLQYGAPRAVDANGVPLRAWLELSGPVLAVAIDASQAAYPLQVESLIAAISPLPDWWEGPYHFNLIEDVQVATAGDVDGDGYSDIMIGAPMYDGSLRDEGKVWVWAGAIYGVSSRLLFEKLSDQEGARFGASISTAGNVDGDGYADIIVGAPYWNDGQDNEGAAWIYYGSAAGVISTPGHYLQGNRPYDHLGESVAFAGDVNGDGYSDVIVGAPQYTSGETQEGRVYVFHGSHAGLVTPSAWRAESNAPFALLGSSVSTAGDVNGDGYADIIVGAEGFTNGQSKEGKAFVWHGSASGVNDDVDGMPSNADWDAEVNVADANFGCSVSTAGDVNGDGYSDVIVGASNYTEDEWSEGGAWIYHGSSAGLGYAWANKDVGNQNGAQLGASVATAGDVNGDGYGDVIAGSPGFTLAEYFEGQAYLWYGHAGGISATRDWDAVGAAEHLHFGTSVATAGDVNGDGYSDIIVGAEGDVDALGEIRVYYGGPQATEETAAWSKASDKEDARFGESVSTAGDVNGDGYADIIVGAPYYDAGEAGEGRVYIYRGSANGLVSAPYWDKHPDQVDAHFGQSVASAGDVNNDGYGDVIVGAPDWEEGYGGDSEGGAWVYRGSSSGMISEPYWHAEGNQAGAQFGWSVSGAGDVDGNGCADVIVGAPHWDAGVDTPGAGRAYVYVSTPAEIETGPSQTYDGYERDMAVGYAVASAGDTDGDGLSEVIVGAPGWDGGLPNRGTAVVLGYVTADGGPYQPQSLDIDSPGAQLGWSVGTAGDVNGDGYADVIVGAPYYTNGQSNEGGAWVFFGPEMDASDAWHKESDQGGAQFGYSVGTAGDVNGDGYADIVLGAPRMTGSLSNEGGAWVYLGSAYGLGSSPAWRGAGREAESWYGTSVGTAGDVNGDGYAEIIVGNPDFNGGITDQGKAWVYYGGGGRGVSLNPRQLNGDLTPVAHLGQTNKTAFVLCLRARTPFWRGLVGLNLETQELGHALDGSNIREGPYDRWAYDRELCFLKESTVRRGTTYHWRLRLGYDPATHPYMPASRWVAMPYHGWNEADLRTPPVLVYLPLIHR